MNLGSSSIETLAERIRGVPINGTLRFIGHPQANTILEIVKMFIDTDYFAEEKFQLELDSGYTTIKKRERFDYESALEKLKQKDDGTRTVKTNTG